LTTIDYNTKEVVVRNAIPVRDLEAISKFAASVLEGTGVLIINAAKAQAINAAIYIERKKA